ncbi:sensor histidine kinase [Holophaga foetida]|uniref:sensor histidine kinase n=1 Tax=Holophaga foetida TaxID=35839 RepID=UPI000247379A|nr:ATP-binding protein [Holophaga foetida]
MVRSSELHPWVLGTLPLAFIFFGLAMFTIRWWRLRRRHPQDPEELLLGAVSQSLHERGALAASLGELRTVHERVLDALPFGLLWVDQRQRVAGLNRAGRELLEVRPGVVGLDAGFVLEPFPWILEGLGREPGSTWRCDGGGRRWSLRRIATPDRVGALVQFEDITEVEQEERRLLLRERFAELGEMTAGVAHQLKNGLAVLKGQGQLLKRAGHGQEATTLLEETEELELLVQRFLQWAKPLEPQCVELELQGVAAQAMREVGKRPLAQGRELVLEGEGRALADPMLLHQALVNLLENACQATPSGGCVRITVGEGSLEILDEGPGLGEDTLIRMLRPFESGRPDGTGLGLPLALKWVNAQGADLRFLSRPEGGTRVSIRW